MKRRLIIGLILLFAVVLVGGGVTAILMDELGQLDQVQYQMDKLGGQVTDIHIGILEAVRMLKEAPEDEKRILALSERMSRMNLQVQAVMEQVSSGELVERGCGTCHTGTEDLSSDLQDLLDRYTEAYHNFTMLTSLLITRGGGVDVSAVMEDLERATEEMIRRMSDLDTLINEMLEHSFSQVRSKLTDLSRTHDLIIIAITVISLILILVMIRSVTRPIHLLTQGTEAIVKGNYGFRIRLPGKDEMSLLAERFNYMAEVLASREGTLQQKRKELEDLNSTLDRKVRERTSALRDKQEELNRKYLEVEAANEELQASYIQLESTAAELQEAQAKLQENFDALKRMNDDLRKANEVKNRFLAVMSHELRTPLTIINGYMGLILEKGYGAPSREIADILRVVKDQGKSQLNLIEDLLDLTRIESGEFRLHRQVMQPGALLAKVEENFRPRLEEKRIELRMDVEQDLPASHWDYQKMTQVFQNLVDNALKFTPAGGWIGITARLRGDFIEVLVADNGIGIPKEKVGQVFDRFYQVDSSATRRYGGVGLGLSIVREIVLAHNGKIFVESEEGKGTTFQVLMPHGVPVRETVEQPAAPSRPPTIAPGKGEKVLLVDDDPSFLEMMRTVLPTEGFHVISTTVSREAMELARAEGVRAILLDLMMADMDGFEVCRRLRNDPATSHLPIIILSAAGGSDVVKRVTAAGADDYLIKPFDNHEVVSRLAELIRHGRGAGKLNRPPDDGDAGGKEQG